jgi:hypothetical protein
MIKKAWQGLDHDKADQHGPSHDKATQNFPRHGQADEDQSTWV